MILGMSLPTFTLVHVVLSLIGIVAGLVVLAGMLRSRRMPGWTAGVPRHDGADQRHRFLFPVRAPAAVSRRRHHLARGPGGDPVCAVRPPPGRRLALGLRLHRGVALYLNVFVLVVQAFLKIPFLKALAPTQAEPPFAIAQGVVLLAFVALGILAVKSFNP